MCEGTCTYVPVAARSHTKLRREDLARSILPWCRALDQRQRSAGRYIYIYLYIYRDRKPSQHVTVGLAWGSPQLWECQVPLSGPKNRFCLTSSIVKRGSFTWGSTDPPSTSSERLGSPECVPYILGNFKRMLLRCFCPCACPSRSAVVPRVPLLDPAGIFSLLDLLQEPSTACKAGVDTLHHRPDILEGGQLLPAARLRRRRTGQIRLAYQLPMCAAVHLRPSLSRKQLRKRLRTGSVRVTTNLYKLADEQLCDRGGRPMPSASPFSTLVVTGNRACETRLWGLCEYVIVHTIFGWQSSHFVDIAGWQAKMASIEIWIPWRNAHKPFKAAVVVAGGCFHFAPTWLIIRDACRHVFRMLQLASARKIDRTVMAS